MHPPHTPPAPHLPGAATQRAHLDRLECPHIGRCDRAAVGGATLKRAVFVLGQQLHLGRLGDVADQCHKYLHGGRG
eukprot:361083-Chlamydomonas_euryale.AAC.2